MSDALYNSPFLKACRGEPAPYTPVWLMRQAGRYMQEYREVREAVSFIDLCKNPDLAAEVAVTAAQRLNVDASILFSDILLILEPMGGALEYVKGNGPVLHNPIRMPVDVDRIQPLDDIEPMSYVFDAVRKTRHALPDHVPLIGFSGAPFTLASYLIEGGGSRHFENTKAFMYRDPAAWNLLLEKLTDALRLYLIGQIKAGAQAVQIFDSWVGCLDEPDYRTYVLPHAAALIRSLPAEVPVIYFGTGTATIIRAMSETGSQVMGIDFRTDILDAWNALGCTAVQGNLDPAVLLADRDSVERKAGVILDRVAGRAGHIFNLGHGVLPSTTVDNVIALVDFVHEKSSKLNDE